MRSAPKGVGDVRDHRPPEHEPDGDEREVLDVQEPGVAQRRVVEGGQVDQIPAREPDGQRNLRARDPGERRGRLAGRGRSHGGGQPKDEQQRSPVGDHHVLEEVEEQQVLDGDRLERRVQGARDEQEPHGEGASPPPGPTAPAGCTRVEAAGAAIARKNGSNVKDVGPDPWTDAVSWACHPGVLRRSGVADPRVEQEGRRTSPASRPGQPS